MKLSEYLKSERITAAEFAERIGVHKATVGRWIDQSSQIRPNWKTMEKIENLTGQKVTVNDWAQKFEAARPADLSRAAE